jgi:hypothetical protein
MSAMNAVPIPGCSTRLLTQDTASACGAVQPIAQHFPPVMCCFPRPVASASENAIAVADRAAASAFTVPKVVAAPPEPFQNLSAGTRPKTWWGIPL